MTNPSAEPVPTRLRLPVTVVLERREIVRRRWSTPSWYLSGVLVGDAFGRDGADGLEVRAGGSAAEPVTTVPASAEYAWTGRAVTLYKDACERYWHALIGDRPLVYAVCRDRAAAPGIEPFVVTIDYDEATSFGETDALVLSTDITPALYRYMEDFVLAHYRPKPFEKRRRKRWAKGEGDGTPMRVAGGLVDGPGGDLVDGRAGESGVRSDGEPGGARS